MTMVVIPETWPTALVQLYLQLVTLLGGFSPFWLLPLAAPTALAARRSWRARQDAGAAQ